MVDKIKQMSTEDVVLAVLFIIGMTATVVGAL